MYKHLPQVSSFVEPCLWQRRIMDPSPDKQATHVVSDLFEKWLSLGAAESRTTAHCCIGHSPHFTFGLPQISFAHSLEQAGEIRADQGLSWPFGISLQEVASREDHRFFFAGTDCVQT